MSLQVSDLLTDVKARIINLLINDFKHCWSHKKLIAVFYSD